MMKLPGFKSEWINFRRVTNEHWYSGNRVLMGDAARTAHFSIGSGTKLAMEDSICLDLYLSECDDLSDALRLYEEERKWYSEKLQSMAQESRIWFETIKRRRHLDQIERSAGTRATDASTAAASSAVPR